MSSITLQPGRSELKRMYKMATSQTLPSGTNPSFDGKTAIITGGTSGFGLACAKILPTLGLSHLILGVRSVERGEKEASVIRQEHPNTKIDVWELDMLDYSSVEAFAMRCKNLARLDIVILNAGIHSLTSRFSPATGHEEVLQVNYLSNALLAILLLPVLKEKHAKDTPGHLTISGSSLGLHAKFPERNAEHILPAFDTEWSGMAAASERYSVSKLLVFMLVLKLSQLVKAEDVMVNVVEPGFSASTRFVREVPFVARAVMSLLHALMGRTPEKGAWTYIDAVVKRNREAHGSFLNNWEIYPFHAMMYSEDGRKVMNRIWNEIIEEQKAYGVNEALSTL